MIQRDTRSNRARYFETRKVANKLCRRRNRIYEDVMRIYESIEGMNK